MTDALNIPATAQLDATHIGIGMKPHLHEITINGEQRIAVATLRDVLVRQVNFLNDSTAHTIPAEEVARAKAANAGIERALLELTVGDRVDAQAMTDNSKALFAFMAKHQHPNPSAGFDSFSHEMRTAFVGVQKALAIELNRGQGPSPS